MYCSLPPHWWRRLRQRAQRLADAGADHHRRHARRVGDRSWTDRAGDGDAARSAWRLIVAFPPTIVANEIRSNDDGPGGWVELYNPTDRTVDLGGWKVANEHIEHAAALPAGTSIGTSCSTNRYSRSASAVSAACTCSVGSTSSSTIRSGRPRFRRRLADVRTGRGASCRSELRQKERRTPARRHKHGRWEVADPGRRETLRSGRGVQEFILPLDTEPLCASRPVVGFSLWFRSR